MNKNKKILIALAALIVGLSIAFTGILAFRNKPKPNVKTVEVIDSIEGYDYKLEDRDSVLYQDIFMLLKSCLEKDEVNFEEYAQFISELFIIDLYSINNKINKYDVGSVEFIYPEVVDNYSLNVRDTLYKYLEDDSNDQREQVLPEVTEIEVLNIDEIEYVYKDKVMPAYEIELSWSYKKDLDYDKSGVVIVVRQNEMLYIIEKTNIEK